MLAQVPAKHGEIGERYPRQLPHGRLDVGWHPEVEDEQGPGTGADPGRPYRRGGHDGGGGPGNGDQETRVGQHGGYAAARSGLPPGAAATSAARASLRLATDSRPTPAWRRSRAGSAGRAGRPGGRLDLGDTDGQARQAEPG